MKQVILSHSGKQHSYHVAKALDELGYLEKFYTSAYVGAKWMQDLIEKRNNKFWSRRFLHGLYGKKVESNWRFEVPEIILNQLYGQNERTLNAVYARDTKFDNYLSKKMHQLRGDIFWGFQGSCFQSLEAAKQEGKLAVCELATAHAPVAKRILEEEKELNPEWADSIDNVTFPPCYFERLCEEPNRADIVIGASRFTLQTLKESGVDEKKLRYLPLGFELDHIPFTENKARRKGPFKLLFAGRITQRKGIKYLLEAMKQFDPKQVELHIIGYVHGSGTALRAFNNFVLHPPMQQYELFKKYSEFDAFVLPTVFEGFGLVILEAMAAGLPVITTPHSIGPEIITQGENGYVVPIRNVASLANVISEQVQKSDDELDQMRQSARNCALRFSWTNYRGRLAQLMQSIGEY
jgi:alpha-maltose-1-phosphate synthase